MSPAPFLLLLPLLLIVGGVHGDPQFRVCAFNLHNFGESKSQKEPVMHVLTKIISRCDVCLLQEVRDAKGTALPELLHRVQRFDTRHTYKAVSSPRLGRSESYKEQYVFMYRVDTAAITGEYQYPDDLRGDQDAFSREPFVVRVRAPQTDAHEFVLVALHSTPSNTTKELDSLWDVLQRVKRLWRTQTVMLLGDFNADCGYLAKKNRVHVRLITDPDLFWLIPDDEDTTVRSSTSCAYDRIVVNGPVFNSLVVPFSARVFNFQKEFRLTEEQALDVSDHYPVEVLLRVSHTTSLAWRIPWVPCIWNPYLLLLVASLVLLSHTVFQTMEW